MNRASSRFYETGAFGPLNDEGRRRAGDRPGQAGLAGGRAGLAARPLELQRSPAGSANLSRRRPRGADGGAARTLEARAVGTAGSDGELVAGVARRDRHAARRGRIPEPHARYRRPRRPRRPGRARRGAPTNTQATGTSPTSKLVSIPPTSRALGKLGARPTCSRSGCSPTDSIEKTSCPIGAARAAQPLPRSARSSGGARIAAGSDWPVSAPDPFLAIQVGMTRQSPEPPIGAPGSGERVSLHTLLAAYTTAAPT